VKILSFALFLKMNIKRQYDSTIPWFFINGKQHLLDDVFIKSIPKSTVAYWMSKGYENYYGQQYRYIMTESMELFELYHKLERLKKVLFGIAKTWIGISKIVLPLLHKDKDKTEWLLNQTQSLFQALPKKLALYHPC
jgi:hypothetical protein